MKPKNRIIKRMLKKCQGHLALTADRLGVTYNCLYNWMKDDKELQLAKKQERAKRHTVVVDKLMENILQGKETSIIFYLKTQCKDSDDENFSERPLLPNQETKILAQNVNINNFDMAKLSTKQLDDLRLILQAAEPEKETVEFKQLEAYKEE